MMPGTWKEKGSTANAALWDDCFLNQKHCQYIAEWQDRHYENSVGHISTCTKSVGQPSGDSLAFLRCSALSFRPQASSTQDEKLLLGLAAFSRSTLESISSINSCGKRIPFVVDRLFLKPVAISFPFCWCRNTIQENKQNKTVDVYVHLNVWCMCTLLLCKAKMAKPESATNTCRASIHNVIGANTMELSHSTQTRPKFVYLFLGTPNEFPDSTPTVLRAEANTEADARAKFPRWTLTFAAQIRTESPCRLQIFSTDEGFMWVYEQRQAVPEVAHA